MSITDVSSSRAFREGHPPSTLVLMWTMKSSRLANIVFEPIRLAARARQLQARRPGLRPGRPPRQTDHTAISHSAMNPQSSSWSSDRTPRGAKNIVWTTGWETTE